MASRAALMQKQKPRHAGGVVFALRERSVQLAPTRESKTGKPNTE
jgi:hypothetical protein